MPYMKIDIYWARLWQDRVSLGNNFDFNSLFEFKINSKFKINFASSKLYDDKLYISKLKELS